MGVYLTVTFVYMCHGLYKTFDEYGFCCVHIGSINTSYVRVARSHPGIIYGVQTNNVTATLDRVSMIGALRIT